MTKRTQTGLPDQPVLHVTTYVSVARLCPLSLYIVNVFLSFALVAYHELICSVNTI